MAYPSNWPQDLTDFANRVMGLIGEVERFTDIDTDTSDNAVLVRETMYDIIRDTPRGLGTFMWEPTGDGEWGQGLFDMPSGTPRSSLSIYDGIADDYGLRYFLSCPVVF